MKREYWIILIVYIGMQLSSLLGIPLLMFLFKFTGTNPKLSVPYWLIISFSAALIIVLLILRKEMKAKRFNERGNNTGNLILWSIFGIFLAFFAQYVGAIVEHFLGIKQTSENTKEILMIINEFPLAMIVSSVFGPILEEIVFRKIIFGGLHRHLNFFFSALISSLIFALAHMDFTHIIIYAAMGFTFAYLYVKTKHIIVPIFAHVVMNTMVVLVQSVYKDDIEKVLRDAEKVQNFIGGFL